MKKLFFLVILFFSFSISFSQSFMHGAGVVIFVGTVTGGVTTVNGGITYSPRINFLEMENSSLSIGIPLSAGISGDYYTDTYGGSENTLSFMLDVPLILNYNIGCGSSKENESRFGFFVGGGFGYRTSSYNENVDDGYGDTYQDGVKVSTFGPVGNAGVRIAVGRHKKNIEIKLSFMKGLDNSSANTYGVHTLFNF
jgi:hypothetical protein